MTLSSIHSFDERRNIALPGSPDQAQEFAVQYLINVAQKAIETTGRFVVALSGGSTPKKIFTLLATPKYRNAVDWSKAFLFWSDERAVPPDHPDSNYKMAMDFGFSKLAVNPDQIFRMKAESHIQEHALEYEKIIRKVLNGHPFDLIMLGMGEDGHTASLFPDTKALHIHDRWVVANEVPQKNCWRMTFTYTLINHSRNTCLYVMGMDKKDMVVKVLMDRSNSFPVAKVGTQDHPALWILDDTAKSELVKEWKPEN